MKRLAILGAGGHGKVVADSALMSGWQEVTFFDDAWPQKSCNGRWPVVGDLSALLASVNAFDGVVVAIGNCVTRWTKHKLLRDSGACMATIIHPGAWVSSYSSVGPGSVLFAGAIVNIDATLGEGCIINTGATVDHDCILGDAVHICPGSHLSGGVSVGPCSWIGVGASIRQGVTVGEDAFVGAGAIVVKDIPSGVTVVGNPARPIVGTKC